MNDIIKMVVYMNKTEDKIFYIDNNKRRLCGILNKCNDKKQIVVICHARTSNKNSRPTTKISNILTENDINNFRFDFVSCGESDGTYDDYNVTNMIKNLNDSLSMLQEKYDYDEFILIGCSMGARIIAYADNIKYKINKLIFWYGALDYGRKIFNLPNEKERVAKKQGYYEGEKGWKFPYSYFVDERKYITYKKIIKNNIHKLFVHGTKDPYVSYKSSVNINKKCTNSKIVLIENGDHGFHDEKNMKEALEKTLEFIKGN